MSERKVNEEKTNTNSNPSNARPAAAGRTLAVILRHIMPYNYENTKIDIDALEKCCEKLKDGALRKIGTIAKDNLAQIAITIALPHFLMTQGVHQIKEFQYLLEGAVATKNILQPKTEEGKKQLNDFVKAKFIENEKLHSNEGRQLLVNLRKNNPFIEIAIQIQALNSLVNVWTIFESVSKEIWIYLLNNYQNMFLNNILDARTDSDAEGISGKYISIQYLGKFGFNVNNRLGEILSSKYDFTSCSGIMKAFIDLDKNQKEAFNYLKNENLYQLELIRNLIVHNAGIIDDTFLHKSKISNETLGKKISISTRKYSKYENSAIESMIKLLKFGENVKITANKPASASRAK